LIVTGWFGGDRIVRWSPHGSVVTVWVDGDRMANSRRPIDSVSPPRASDEPAGLLCLYKPIDMMSRAAVDRVVEVAGTSRVGHAGTLDPLASGLLVVCVGWATRLVPYIQDREKSYTALFRLGCDSNTDDITGTVIERTDATVPDRAAVDAALNRFVGEILQTPPQFSAVKVNGRRAYEAARKGKRVSLQPRKVTVTRIHVVRYDWPELRLEIDCGSGTYIRSIGRDLGNELGCGAVMTELVRTRIGEFAISGSTPVEELTTETIATQLLQPLTAVAHLPQFNVSAADLRTLIQGRPIRVPSLDATGDEAAAVTDRGELAALIKLVESGPMWRPTAVFPPARKAATGSDS
jgi:tRNA pseudouridine55 synthase